MLTLITELMKTLSRIVHCLGKLVYYFIWQSHDMSSTFDHKIKAEVKMELTKTYPASFEKVVNCDEGSSIFSVWQSWSNCPYLYTKQER